MRKKRWRASVSFPVRVEISTRVPGGLVRLPVDGRQVLRRSQVDQRRFDLHLGLVPDPETLDLPDGHLAAVPAAGDFPDMVFKLDEADLRRGKPRLVPQQGPGSGVPQTAAGLPVPPFVQLPPQQRAVRSQGSVRDHQPVRGEHHRAAEVAEKNANPVQPVEGPEVDEDALQGIGQGPADGIDDFVRGQVVPVDGAALVRARPDDAAAALEGRQGGVLSEGPHLQLGQARPFAPVVAERPLFFGAEQFPVLLFELPFASGAAAAEVLDVPSPGRRQGLVLLAGNLPGLSQAGAGRHHLDEADDVAGETGVGVFAGADVEAELPLPAVGALGAAHLPVGYLFAERDGLAGRDQHLELQEGVAQFLVDEAQHDPAGRHRPAQVDLDPPGFRRQGQVGLPEGVRPAVDHAGGLAVVGAGRVYAPLFLVFPQGILPRVETGVVHAAHEVGSHPCGVDGHRPEGNVPGTPPRRPADVEAVAAQQEAALRGGRLVARKQECRRGGEKPHPQLLASSSDTRRCPLSRAGAGSIAGAPSPAWSMRRISRSRMAAATPSCDRSPARFCSS